MGSPALLKDSNSCVYGRPFLTFLAALSLTSAGSLLLFGALSCPHIGSNVCKSGISWTVLFSSKEKKKSSRGARNRGDSRPTANTGLLLLCVASKHKPSLKWPFCCTEKGGFPLLSAHFRPVSLPYRCPQARVLAKLRCSISRGTRPVLAVPPISSSLLGSKRSAGVLLLASAFCFAHFVSESRSMTSSSRSMSAAARAAAEALSGLQSSACRRTALQNLLSAV